MGETVRVTYLLDRTNSISPELHCNNCKCSRAVLFLKITLLEHKQLSETIFNGRTAHLASVMILRKTY